MLKTMAQPVFKTLDSKAIEYEGRFPKAHVVYKHLTGIHLTLDLGDRNVRSHLGQMGIVHAWGELQTLDMVNWGTEFAVRRKPVHGRLREQVPPSWRSGDCAVLHPASLGHLRQFCGNLEVTRLPFDTPLT